MTDDHGITFAAAASGYAPARILLDQLEPFGPCEYCSWGFKGYSGHFFGCSRFNDGEIVGSPVHEAKLAYARGEIDLHGLERRLNEAFRNWTERAHAPP